MNTFKGKIANLPGTASGIGRETALRLAERGCATALIDIDPNGLESVEKELVERGESIDTDRMKRIFPIADHPWIAQRWDEESAGHIASRQARP